MTLRLDGQTLHIGYPDAGQYIDAPLNGVETPMRGPHAPEGATYAAHSVGRREILTLSKRNGKAILQGSLELSDDGRMIIDSWWTPSQSIDKGRLVYEKE
jgi:hypothetical protein